MTAKERKEKLLQGNPSPTTTETKKEYNNNSKFSIPETSNVSIDSILSKRIDETIEIKPIIPTVFIAGSRYAVKGDISMISGKPKAGKSTITKLILATALMKEVSEDLDTLGIRSNYCEGQTVIYIDTEQNPSDTLDFYREVLKITGLKTPPKNFIVLNWRDFDYNECLNHLVAIFEHMKNIYMIVLDGITDLIPSSNDETSSVMMIRYLMKESTVRNTCIIACIHENGDSGKMRGHIGAEAARKCQGTISIRWDEAKGVRTIKPLYLRKGKLFEEIYWQSNEGIPESCTAEMTEKFKSEQALEDKRAKECINILNSIYEKMKGKGLNLAELNKYIKIYMPTKTGESTDACRKRCSRYLDTMKKLEILIVTDNLYYYQNNQTELFN